jgi:hypothetical protein
VSKNNERATFLHRSEIVSLTVDDALKTVSQVIYLNKSEVGMKKELRIHCRVGEEDTWRHDIGRRLKNRW